jgi:serine protease inhibitor
MMNNPIHDHDREKASSIVENKKINKNVLLTNPYFQNGKWGVNLKKKEIKLGMKELYR